MSSNITSGGQSRSLLQARVFLFWFLPFMGFIVSIAFGYFIVRDTGGGLADLFKDGVYRIIEYIFVTIAALTSIFSYYKYISSVPWGDLPEKNNKLWTLIAHTGLCVSAFAVCLWGIATDKPSIYLVSSLCVVYCVYIWSNVIMIEILCRDEIFLKYAENKFKEHAKYINQIGNTIFFLRDENYISYAVYVFIAFVSLIVCLLAFLPGSDRELTFATLKAFTSGAAVVHLVISAFKFRYITYGFHSIKSKKEDIVELLLRITDDDRLTERSRGARMQAVRDSAIDLVNGKIWEIRGLSIRRMSIVALIAALVASGICIAVQSDIWSPPDSVTSAVGASAHE